MTLKKFLLFGLFAAILPAVAEEAADRKTATSLKYVEHELDTRQNKFTAESNKAMEYTDSAGTVQKRAVTSNLGSSTSDTSLPMVGGVNTKLATKQDDIAPINDHTAVTYTGQSGSIGTKGIYQDTGTYAEQSDNLIDAKTFNAALKKGLDSEFLCSEYKPGTDLCWVWSIHNNGDNNLFTTSGATLGYFYNESGEERPSADLAHTDYIAIQPTTTYTYSVTCVRTLQTNHRVIAWDENKNFISQIGNIYCDTGDVGQRLHRTFTTTAATKYITLNYVVNPAGENPRLELGSSATEGPYTTLVPDGYTPLEYIISDGTQYINTGIAPTNTTSVSAKAALLNLATGPSFFGSLAGGANLLVGTGSTGTGQIYVNGTSNVTDISITANTVYEVSVAGTTFSIKASGGQTQTLTAPAVTGGSGNIYMIGRNYNGSVQRLGSFNYYYMKIYNDGALVRNFIPAQDASGVVGMYDTVEGRFFPSAASNTNFAPGPEISNIVYIPQNQ